MLPLLPGSLPLPLLKGLRCSSPCGDRWTLGQTYALQAIKLAGQWGHQSVLPLLCRGLHDSDSRVVEAAAAAIERHRGGHQPAQLNPCGPRATWRGCDRSVFLGFRDRCE